MTLLAMESSSISASARSSSSSTSRSSRTTATLASISARPLVSCRRRYLPSSSPSSSVSPLSAAGRGAAAGRSVACRAVGGTPSGGGTCSWASSQPAAHGGGPAGGAGAASAALEASSLPQALPPASCTGSAESLSLLDFFFLARAGFCAPAVAALRPRLPLPWLWLSMKSMRSSMSRSSSRSCISSFLLMGAWVSISRMTHSCGGTPGLSSAVQSMWSTLQRSRSVSMHIHQRF
mmetsp:Transcript_9541/g.25916  ORF Transcript_9541/g.25916 Transcript_9541/m.25916 type:complete len:235 (+) Transcript_9541:253-957(+)